MNRNWVIPFNYFKTPLAFATTAASLTFAGAAGAQSTDLEQRLAEFEARIADAEQRADLAESEGSLSSEEVE